MPNILLVSDAERKASLGDLLTDHGYSVHEATGTRQAVALARRNPLDGMVLDLTEPGLDGLAVLDAVKKQLPGLPALVVSADLPERQAESGIATELVSATQLMHRLGRQIATANLRGDLPMPPTQARQRMEELGIVAESRAMLELFESVKRVAPYLSTVLLVGESGTGKELIARALHAMGPHPVGPFVPVNCATLSDPLLESELFGHEPDGFAGADAIRPGVMEVAHGGTLFLDEIDELGLGCQAKLLRAIERHEFRRVGGTRKIAVDINLIAATNVDLEQRVAEGGFRADLYYRLKVVTLTVPPLRERREAIPRLAHHFVDEIVRKTGLPPKRFTPAALAQLARHEWPGNVRELKNAVESLMLMVRGEVIDVDDLPPPLRSAKVSSVHITVGMTFAEIEREVLRHYLDTYPTIKEAARVLGIGLRTMHDKITRHGLRRTK